MTSLPAGGKKKITVEVEAKAKEPAVLRLKDDMERLHTHKKSHQED